MEVKFLKIILISNPSTASSILLKLIHFAYRMVLMYFTFILDQIMTWSLLSFPSSKHIKWGCKEVLKVGTLTQSKGIVVNLTPWQERENTLSKEAQELRYHHKLSSIWFSQRGNQLSPQALSVSWSCSRAQWLVLTAECCESLGKDQLCQPKEGSMLILIIIIIIAAAVIRLLVPSTYYISDMWWSLPDCHILPSSSLLLSSQLSMVLPIMRDLPLQTCSFLPQCSGLIQM